MKFLRHTWCVARNYSSNHPAINHYGYVKIYCVENGETLVWCAIMQNQKTGELSYEPVKIDELPMI